MGKWCFHASSFIFDRIIIRVACNQDRHKSSVEFDLGRIRSLVLELLALEWRKVHTFELEYLWSQLARHISSDEFDFGPLPRMAHLYILTYTWGKQCHWTIYFRLICLDCWKDHIWPWHIGLRWAIVALWATCYVCCWFGPVTWFSKSSQSIIIVLTVMTVRNNLITRGVQYEM